MPVRCAIVRRWPTTSGIFLIGTPTDRKSTRLNSSHLVISYAVFCLKKKKYNVYQHNYRSIASVLTTSFTIEFALTLHDSWLHLDVSILIMCSISHHSITVIHQWLTS